jgi:hypothetical protein
LVEIKSESERDCEDDERIGIVALADKLRSICFVQGISSGRIQTIVRSRNGNTFDEIAETVVEEESAIFSKNESYRQGTAFSKLLCSNCWAARASSVTVRALTTKT